MPGPLKSPLRKVQENLSTRDPTIQKLKDHTPVDLKVLAKDLSRNLMAMPSLASGKDRMKVLLTTEEDQTVQKVLPAKGLSENLTTPSRHGQDPTVLTIPEDQAVQKTLEVNDRSKSLMAMPSQASEKDLTIALLPMTAEDLVVQKIQRAKDRTRNLIVIQNQASEKDRMRVLLTTDGDPVVPKIQRAKDRTRNLIVIQNQASAKDRMKALLTIEEDQPGRTVALKNVLIKNSIRRILINPSAENAMRVLMKIKAVADSLPINLLINRSRNLTSQGQRPVVMMKEPTSEAISNHLAR
jgi:hypothetical protein